MVRYCQYSVPIILPPILGMIIGRTGQQKSKNLTRGYMDVIGFENLNFLRRKQTVLGRSLQQRGGNHVA